MKVVQDLKTPTMTEVVSTMFFIKITAKVTNLEQIMCSVEQCQDGLEKAQAALGMQLKRGNSGN
jgi:hypothetical protein